MHLNPLFSVSLFFGIGYILVSVGGIWYALGGKTDSERMERNVPLFFIWLAGLCIGLILVVVGGTGVDNHNVLSNRDGDNFNLVAHDLFVGIKTEAHNLALQNNPTAGAIFLKDSSTAIIANAVGKATHSLSKNFYSVPLNTRGENLTLTGSLSADNKNWCFVLSTPYHEQIDTQDGYLMDGTSSGYCLFGFAYDGNDKLVK